MKSNRKIVTIFLSFLLLSATSFALINAASAQSTSNSGQLQISEDSQWIHINSTLITLLFPADGKKPMFLWYYTNDTSRVFVVKYKGLVEYATLDQDYYSPNSEANAQMMQSLMTAKYGATGEHMNLIRAKIASEYVKWLADFHPSYLPFSACKWNLTGPVVTTDSNGASVVSFNFTLQNAPARFSFADGNIILRFRFYENQSTQQPYGLYNYSANPGELKMDVVIKDWSWNLDQMNAFFVSLQNDYNITVPQRTGGLTLWTNLATINMQNLTTAQTDADEPQSTVPDNSTLAPTDPVESSSTTTDMIAAGQQIHVQNVDASDTSPMAVNGSLAGRNRLQFATGDKTLAGFFDFVSNAAVINQTTGVASLVNVTAAYRQAGTFMQLFIGYPYFGANTLEHDPTIGVDTAASVIPENGMLMVLFSAAIVTVVAASVVILRKGSKKPQA